MPELPEVETIKLGLQKYLVGQRIESVDVRLPRILTGDVKNIIGARFTDIKRYGKGLVLELDNGYSLAIHIKLTGQIIYHGSDEPKGTKASKAKVGILPNKFTHIIFTLNPRDSSGKNGELIDDQIEGFRTSLSTMNSRPNGRNDTKEKARLYYNDIRQFGWVKIIKTSDIKSLPFFKDLGPEPFDDLTFPIFKKIISSSKTVIKPLIMDQKKIGGIGNIYANDALFLARILPTRKANTLSDIEIKKLFESIETVLKKGLKYGGASELTYVNALGQEGSYQDHMLVYGKVGEPCGNCGGKIKKIFLGGRGTFYCDKCQV